MTITDIRKAHEAAKPKYQSDRCGNCGDFCFDGTKYCQSVTDMDQLLTHITDLHDFVRAYDAWRECNDSDIDLLYENVEEAFHKMLIAREKLGEIE